MSDCGEKGKQRTIVPLIAKNYWNSDRESISGQNLSKKNNWVELWITGLDSEVISPGDIADMVLENEFSTRCSVMKAKNCLYPFFTGIVQGKVDLDCYANHIRDNTPSNQD